MNTSNGIHIYNVADCIEMLNRHAAHEKVAISLNSTSDDWDGFKLQELSEEAEDSLKSFKESFDSEEKKAEILKDLERILSEIRCMADAAPSSGGMFYVDSLSFKNGSMGFSGVVIEAVQ